MSVQESLENFQKKYCDVLRSLEELKSKTKEHGSDLIQGEIRENKFEKATRIITELDEFTKIALHSNVEEISEAIEKLFNESDGGDGFKLNKNMFVVNEEMTPEEKKALEVIGCSGDSRFKDVEKYIEKQAVETLSEKGFLVVEEINVADDLVACFELSQEGIKKFEELFQTNAVQSVKNKIVDKYGSLENGYFMYDMEHGFEDRGFEIRTINEKEVEVVQEGEYFYLTPDFGNFNKTDYQSIMEEKFELMNIGFIATNMKTMENAKKEIENWMKNNKEKTSKFLSIHFTTIHNLENSNRIFETIKPQ